MPPLITPIFTPRLALLPLSREMIVGRLEAEQFTLTLELSEGPQDVHFGSAWPGEPLRAFPYFLTQVKDGLLRGSFVAIRRGSQEAEAIGLLGTNGKLSAAGAQEIGYGFNPAHWGQGYATEAAHALVQHLLAQPEIRTVTAQTALSNRASERVLQKLGFRHTGRGWNEKDGELKGWTYAPA